MRWLEVRRHSLTRKDSARDRGSHLSADGVALARLVGESLGPFASVVTSASPRAIETAVAMGFAVDDTVELPSGYVPGEVDRHEQWRWPRPYRTYAELLGRGGGLATVAEAHRRIWTSVVAAVPDGAAALVVGHGGGIEPVNEGGFVSVQFRRAPEQKEGGKHETAGQGWGDRGDSNPRPSGPQPPEGGPGSS